MHDQVVMVTEAYALGMIGVIRSIGSAGYPVHAVSSDPRALGFHSRLASAHALHPPYGDPSFLPWLRSYVRKHDVQAIVPSEGFLHAIAPVYEEFRRLLPDSNELAVVERCMSKVATFEHLSAHPDTAGHQPQSGVVRELHEIPDASLLRRLSTPVYVKRDAGLARTGNDAGVRRCASAEEVRERLAEALATHRAVLWQAHVPGKKVGVSLWRHDGEYRAENMVLGIHQQPHTGGMMSLRRTFWHSSLLDDAKRKMSALGWNGAAMMEYKWDPVTDDFWFIEINARYWGYLHLDLYAGKPIPQMQVDAFFGHPSTNTGPASHPVTCRNTFPGEWSYLASRWRDPGVALPAKIASTAGFGLRFLAPMRSDLHYPGDRALYWRQLGRFLRDTVLRAK